MLAILGGGFGLYGYLPAALSLPDPSVVLLERYRSILRERAELAPFEERVRWVNSEHDALSMASRLVVARRPDDQRALLAQVERYPKLRALVLEKPLAGSPAASIELARQLNARDIPFRVGYTLARTPWASRLAAVLSQPATHDVQVRWDFMAHHYQNSHATWKRETPAGGGALRFYAVQLLAAVTRSSPDVPQLLSSSLTVDAQHTVREWEGVLRVSSGSIVRLHVNSHSSAPRFVVHEPERLDIDLGHPFGELSATDGQDVRVSLLAGILGAPSALSDFAWSERVHALWLAAETEAEIASSVTASFSIPTIRA